MIKIDKMCLGMFSTNCYIVRREESDECLVFDPADSGKYIYDTLTEKGLKVAGIFITHGHFDHIYGVDELRSLSGAKVYAGTEEEKLLSDESLNCSLQMGRVVKVTPDYFLRDGEEIDLAGIKIKAIETPGHTIGSVSFYIEEAASIIVGDLIFMESVGRTDLPTGSMKTLVQTAKEKILTLPDKTRIYPGHGGTTTVGNEKDYNPFLS